MLLVHLLRPCKYQIFPIFLFFLVLPLLCSSFAPLTLCLQFFLFIYIYSLIKKVHFECVEGRWVTYFWWVTYF